MPKESLNIYLTATDKLSPALASIADKTRELDKETQQLQRNLEEKITQPRGAAGQAVDQPAEVRSGGPSQPRRKRR